METHVSDDLPTMGGGGGEDDVGGGGATGLAASSEVLLYGPAMQSRRACFVLACATGEFSLAVRITHDQGTTWTTAHLAEAALVGTGGDATYLYVCKLDVMMPSFAEVVLINNSGAALDYRYDLRTYEIVNYV